MKQFSDIRERELYSACCEFGHEFILDHPDIAEIAIESAIYNNLIELEPDLVKFSELANSIVKRAMPRVLEIRSMIGAREKISQAIQILEELQPITTKVITEQQDQDVYDPSISVENDFESVIDMLNKLDEYVKYTV